MSKTIFYSYLYELEFIHVRSLHTDVFREKLFTYIRNAIKKHRIDFLYLAWKG